MWTIVPFRIVAVLIAGVYALNDWNEPCTFGECHYGPLLCLSISFTAEFQRTDLDSDGSSGTLKMVRYHLPPHVAIILTSISFPLVGFT